MELPSRGEPLQIPATTCSWCTAHLVKAQSWQLYVLLAQLITSEYNFVGTFHPKQINAVKQHRLLEATVQHLFIYLSYVHIFIRGSSDDVVCYEHLYRSIPELWHMFCCLCSFFSDIVYTDYDYCNDH